jgi:PAS domain-containing protein
LGSPDLPEDGVNTQAFADSKFGPQAVVRLRAAFEGSRHPMLLADDQRRWVTGNAAACDLRFSSVQQPLSLEGLATEAEKEVAVKRPFQAQAHAVLLKGKRHRADESLKSRRHLYRGDHFVRRIPSAKRPVHPA